MKELENKNNLILAIDPGDIESAYVIWDGKNILEFNKVPNKKILERLINIINDNNMYVVVIEMISSYGMPVGKNVFETCVWIGRFIQEYSKFGLYDRIYRKDIKMHLCNSTRAKDSNVIQALVDRFGDVHQHGKYSKGTKKNNGFFFGFSKDIWQAFAVAVYYYDINFSAYED